MDRSSSPEDNVFANDLHLGMIERFLLSGLSANQLTSIRDRLYKRLNLLTYRSNEY